MKVFISLVVIVILVVIFGLYYVANFLFKGVLEANNPWFEDNLHAQVNPDIEAEHDPIIDERTESQLEKGTTFWNNFDEECQIQSEDNLTLYGRIFKAETPSEKWMIGVHGYRTDGLTDMGYISSHLVKMGYNCLVIDQRGHGQSEGKYITMGWMERLDLLRWTDYIEKEKAPSEIMWMSDSMGAATALMASGEKVPSVVHGIIADCGYTSVVDLFNYMLKSTFKLPTWIPLIPMFNLICKRKLGFSMDVASAYNQLKKNKLPILFIHGDADAFVPYYMSEQNMKATQGEKELVIFKDAPHFSSVIYDPDKYFASIQEFINTYSK